VANSYFDFKQFRLTQNRQVFKLSTDSVLLGAWAKSEKTTHILDIGTGTGILALMTAQRFPNAQIDAIDIDADAVQCATFNFEQSKWNDRLQIHHSSLHNFISKELSGYDLIISNPPYFQNQFVSPYEKKRRFKHTEELSYESLFFYADKFCSATGTFALILPADVDILPIALENHFFLCRKTVVFVRPQKLPKRILWQFSRKDGSVDFSTITIHDLPTGTRYSDAYKQLTGTFYLEEKFL